MVTVFCRSFNGEKENDYGNETTAVSYLSFEDGSVEVDLGSTLAIIEDVVSFQFIEDYRQDLFEDGYIYRS